MDPEKSSSVLGIDRGYPKVTNQLSIQKIASTTATTDHYINSFASFSGHWTKMPLRCQMHPDATMGPGPVVFPGFRTPSYEALKYDTGFMAKHRVSSFQHRPPRMQSNLSQRLDLGVPRWEIARLGLRWSVLTCLVLSYFRKNMI